MRAGTLTRELNVACAREHDVLAAVYARDLDKMRQLMAADGLAVDATLGCVTQQTCMERIGALADGAGFEIEEPALVHCDDRVVVLVYRLRQHGWFEGAPLPPVVHSTSVWSRADGAWKAVFHHETVASADGAVDARADSLLEVAGHTRPAAEERIIARERALVRAAVSSPTTFTRYVSPDVAFITHLGRQGRRELIEAFQTLGADESTITAFRTIAAAANAVVVTYRIGCIYCSSVWLERRDGWELVCHQHAAAKAATTPIVVTSG
jgi:hypothetical protein